MRGSRVLVVASLLLCAPAMAHAYCLETTIKPKRGELCATAGIPLFWPRRCILFSVMDPGAQISPLEDVQAVAEHAFSTWLDVSCDGAPLAIEVEQSMAPAECAKPEYNEDGANANSVLFIDDWTNYERMSGDAFGLTILSVDLDTGAIYDADILINETLGPLSVCGDACPSGAIDIENVLVHEAGHLLGLGHSDDTDATMSPTAKPGQVNKRTLNDDDRAGVCAIYGDDEQPNCSSSDFTPQRGFSPECDAPAVEAKTLLSSSASGCSVHPVRSSLRPGPLATMLVMLALVYLRRARRR